MLQSVRPSVCLFHVLNLETVRNSSHWLPEGLWTRTAQPKTSRRLLGPTRVLDILHCNELIWLLTWGCIILTENLIYLHRRATEVATVNKQTGVRYSGYVGKIYYNANCLEQEWNQVRLVLG